MAQPFYCIAGYVRRVFIFGCFEEALLSKINSQILLFFENKFPQVIVTCFHVIEQHVFARAFFTSLSSVLLIAVEQYHYCINSL